MKNAHARALTIAASEYVDCDQLKLDACELYPRLKSLSQTDNLLLVGEIDDFSISTNFQHLKVTELVQEIEASANQMIEFGKIMLAAAYEGLMEAVEEPGFEMDATRWDFEAFAEACI